MPNILGLKDAAGNPGATAAVKANAPADFEVYSGDDAMTLPLLAIGAVGVIGVATHWCAPDQVEMFDAWERGDVLSAQRINARQLESFEFETGDVAPNPVPSKAMMRTLGHDVGECRSPMGPTPDGLEAAARQVYDRLVAARALTPTVDRRHAEVAPLPSGSSSSAVSARSAATAWRSSRAPPTIPVARSCSSTAG